MVQLPLPSLFRYENVARTQGIKLKIVACGEKKTSVDGVAIQLLALQVAKSLGTQDGSLPLYLHPSLFFLGVFSFTTLR
jgi:hypothetical protein